jgi:ferredoxin-fold anticodon binding domain-containing protein
LVESDVRVCANKEKEPLKKKNKKINRMDVSCIFEKLNIQHEIVPTASSPNLV